MTNVRSTDVAHVIVVCSQACKWSATKLTYMYQCTGCDSFHLQPMARMSQRDGQPNPRFMPGKAPTVSGQCDQCGWDFNFGGPFWNEKLHDDEWVKVRSCRLHVDSPSVRLPLLALPPSRGELWASLAGLRNGISTSDSQQLEALTFVSCCGLGLRKNAAAA